MKSCTFSNIVAINQGVFQINVLSSITIESSNFVQNSAILNGVFKISGDSFFHFYGLVFIENSAYLKNSIGQAIQIGSASTISQCTFEKNSAFFIDYGTIKADKDNSGKLIEFITIDARIDILDSHFIQNKALVGTSNLYILDSTDVYIVNSQFQGATQMQNNSVYGDFLYISSTSSVSIISSVFRQGFAQSGGALFVLGSASVNIQSSQFIENVALEQGGVIFADSIKSIRISSSCSFKNNKGIKNGGDALYIYNSLSGQVSIAESHFTSLNIESNFIFAIDIQILKLDRIKADIQSFTIQLGIQKFSGIYLRNIAKLKVIESNFSGLIGSNYLGGGSVVIEQTNALQEDIVEIKDCIFKDSHASNRGGGLSIIDIKSTIIRTSTFFNNSADKQGGGLMFACNETGLIRDECKLVIENCSFNSNSAKIEGGAIKWNFYEPYIVGGITFINNSASIYGDNVAGVANQLVVVNFQQLGQRKYIKQNYGNNVKAVSSGGEINLYFGIIDNQGEFVRTENKSNLFISQVEASIINLALQKKPIMIKILLPQLQKQRHNSFLQMVSSKWKILFLLPHLIQVKVISQSIITFRAQFCY
ncbi:hypothetical protein FGO68_gene15731 [Halteria grandinella]|uniref:Right handed beta helix domain-containing protein n=1 Tax=Halteria grandinella TaxID=5974 RepID=A0A8J8TA99_HALGN|nr:hypothetical protein FGO68_gene15731 [Halteria grandinella]